MQVEMDINVMARRIQVFAAARGVRVALEDCLEEAAMMMGFHGYRAYCDQEAVPAQGATPLGVFDTVLEDWAVMQQAVRREAVPPQQLQAYQVVVRHQPGDSSVGVDVLPKGKSPEACLGLPALALNIEINEGLPCVQIYNSPLGDCLGTVYGLGNGVLVAEGNAKWVSATSLEPTNPLAQAAAYLTRYSKSEVFAIETTANAT